MSKIVLESDTGAKFSINPESGLSADKEIVPANINGDASQRFKVAPAVEDDEAINKVQLEDRIHNVVVQNVTHSVSYLSKSGYNSQAIIVDGKLYQANGTNGYATFTTGVYNNGANTKHGVMNGWNNINYDSNSPIKKVGGFMYTYAFILTEAGELFTFGHNTNGQCGAGHTNPIITPVLAETGVLDVYAHPSQGEYSVNNNRLFILKSDGLYAAGYNGYGQLGVGDTATRSTFTKCVGFNNTSSNYIVKVFPIGNAYGSTWILTSDGKLYAVGTNNTGQLGDSTTTHKSSFVDVTSYWVTSGKTLVDVKITGGARYYDSADHGSQGTIVMLLKYSDGTSEVKTAGNNAWGSLGNGSTTSSSSPVIPSGVPTDGSVIDIAGFGGPPLTVQALCSNGDLWAWGYNGYGQVGDGTTTQRNTPTVVTTGVTKLFSDGMTSHSYGYRIQSFIQKSDGLYITGQNDGSYYAGLGVENTSNVTSFTKVKLPEDDNKVIDIGHYTTTTHGRITLALTNKGNIYTWGFNGNNGIHTDNGNNVPIPQLINIPTRQEI